MDFYFYTNSKETPIPLNLNLEQPFQLIHAATSDRVIFLFLCDRAEDNTRWNKVIQFETKEEVLEKTEYNYPEPIDLSKLEGWWRKFLARYDDTPPQPSPNPCYALYSLDMGANFINSGTNLYKVNLAQTVNERPLQEILFDPEEEEGIQVAVQTHGGIQVVENVCQVGTPTNTQISLPNLYIPESEEGAEFELLSLIIA